MPLILLKTEKNVIYVILHRKSILQHEKAVFYEKKVRNISTFHGNSFFFSELHKLSPFQRF